MATAYMAREIFTGNSIETGKAILVREKKIVGLVQREDIPAGFRKVELEGYMLAPAFIDLQIYGGNGKLFSTELTTESLEATYEYCLSGGCTRFMITMATNSTEKYLRGIETVRQYWSAGGRGLLGLHLEGPYINPFKKGAHLEKFIRKPELRELESLLKTGKGVVKMMTLAPEQCEHDILELLFRHSIIVSAGHTNATYSQGIDGFSMGIPAATHLFNAMSALQGREPGMVGAIYDYPDVASSIVCDGIHVDFASVRISKKLLGERLFFITDAVAEVQHGEYHHILRSDRYCLPDGTLSGSALTMMKAVQNGVEKVGISLPEALRMASLYPARLLKASGLGLIGEGAMADLVLIGDQLELQQVIVEGE
jgi:N-acetylglucosamine-6-phosphate deacetylase